MTEVWAERIWTELRRIADALEALVPAQTQTPEEMSGCPHPEAQVIAMGTTPDGEPEWECRACRYHHPPQAP